MPGNSAAAYATASILHSSSSTSSSNPAALSISLQKHAPALPQYGEYYVDSPCAISEKEDYVFCDPVCLHLCIHLVGTDERKRLRSDS